MELTRRSFFKGALSVAAVAAAPAVLFAEAPTLWGDGIHDDTEALNALLSGKPVVVQGEGFIAEQAMLHGGRFKVSDTLHIRADNMTVEYCEFAMDEALGDRHFVEIANVRNVALRSNIFNIGGPQPSWPLSLS